MQPPLQTELLLVKKETFAKHLERAFYPPLSPSPPLGASYIATL
jgi:hypothetical protein